jgi:hypothetical protein
MKKKIYLCGLLVAVSMFAGFVFGRLSAPEVEQIEEITYSPENAEVVEIIEYNSIAVTDTEGNEWCIAVDVVDVSEVEEQVTVAEMIKRFEK